MYKKETEKKIRKTGIEIIGDVSWGTHLCQFYKTKEDLIDILVPYFKAGLENNEFCMWITSEPLKVEDAKIALKNAVKDSDDYIKKGQIQIVPHIEWYPKDGVFNLKRVLNDWINKLNQALAKGYEGMRVTGNTAWLENKDWKSFVDYEEEINKTIGKYNMIAVCTYSLGKCDASEIIDAVSNHQFALIRREGKWEIIESSERKKTEEKLQKSQEKYRNLFEGIADPIFVADSKTGILTDCNRAALELIGRERTEVIDQHQRILHPPERIEKGYSKSFKKHVEEEGGQVLEEQVVTKDGEIKYVAIKANLFELEGKKQIQAVFRDITMQKKAEQELKSLKEFNGNIVANISSAIIVFDKNLKQVSANYAFYKTYKETPERGIGKTIHENLPPELISRVKIDKKILKAFKTDKIIEDFNLEVDTPYIGKRILNIKYVPIVKCKAEEEEHVMVVIDNITIQKKLEKDKKILSEKVIKLTKKIPLTQNEKLVFYGLVKYPLLNDQQLSEKLKIKRSTITAIKNRLLRQYFYSTYAVPNFELIGGELMCILNGKAPIGDIEERKKLGIIKKIMSSPEVVYDIGTDKDFLSIIVSKNFVEAKKLVDYVLSLYEGEGIEMPDIIYFPFAMSRIINLFDYSALLKSLFNLDIKEETSKPIKSIKRELTNNEKIILYALTKYPGLADTEIAAKTKISRQTVNQIKKNLIKENLLGIINIPDVKRLNCELLAYSNIVIDSKKIGNQKPPPLPEQLIFMINSERESSGIFIFENYTKHKMICDKFLSVLKKEQLIIGEPKKHLIPIQQIKSQKIDFAPLVKKIFELDVDF